MNSSVLSTDTHKKAKKKLELKEKKLKLKNYL